jgi:hypothetical protein
VRWDVRLTADAMIRGGRRERKKRGDGVDLCCVSVDDDPSMEESGRIFWVELVRPV